MSVALPVVSSLFVLACLYSGVFAQTNSTHEEPIRLAPENPHYFLYRGKVVALITSGEHYGAVFNADFDYHKYLDTLAADGLNYTRLFGGAYVEVPGKSFGIRHNDLAPAPGKFVPPWARSETPGYAGGGNKFDLAKWNPEYFSRLHDFLGEAVRRGIIVELTLFSSQYGDVQWDFSPFKPENNINATDVTDWKKLNTPDNGKVAQYQEQYVRKLVREVNAYPNVIFEIANEPWSDRPVLADVVNPYLFTGRDQYPNSVDLPDDATMAWQTSVARWIASEEAALPNRHLVAQDCCNFRYAVKDVLPEVSVVNFHYAYPEAAQLNYGLGKALSYDETGFLGRDDSAYARQAWNFMMSGGGVFDSLDYSFSVGHEDGTDNEPNGPGGGSAELRKRLRILSEFMRSLPLAQMHPDLNVVKHAAGVTTHVLSNGHGIYAMYVDGNGPANVTLTLPAGAYSLRWVDVETGRPNEMRIVSTGDVVVKTPGGRGGVAELLRQESRK
jgi:hypothetical protein